MGQDRGCGGSVGVAAAAYFDAFIQKLAESVVERITDQFAEVAPTNQLLTTEQLAERLQCSPRTIYTLRQRGLPCLMLGESPRFEFDAVREFLGKDAS